MRSFLATFQDIAELRRSRQVFTPLTVLRYLDLGATFAVFDLDFAAALRTVRGIAAFHDKRRREAVRANDGVISGDVGIRSHLARTKIVDQQHALH